MDQDRWSAVDRLIVERLGLEDPVLAETRAASDAAGLPGIAVSPPQGAMLEVLVLGCGASRVLEIGTLGGYSTTFLARGVGESGRVVSLEADERHAEVARANIARAGLADRVEVRLGKAAESLAALEAEGAAPFDFVFIDADKPNNAGYLDWSARLGRAGTMIVVDNVVRRGRIADADTRNASVEGSLGALDFAGADSRFAATAIQTVGEKGYDGFILAVVLTPGERA